MERACSGARVPAVRTSALQSLLRRRAPPTVHAAVVEEVSFLSHDFTAVNERNLKMPVRNCREWQGGRWLHTWRVRREVGLEM